MNNYIFTDIDGVLNTINRNQWNKTSIGVRKTTPATNPFDSYISLVSVYEGALNTNDIEKLWAA